MTTPYIGSKISLISRLDIRYEGTLHSVDPIDSTISLSQVRSFGTEDRPAPVTVPSRDEVYEFIIFKASDIKDLIVCETPKPPEAPPSVNDINYDPAIVSVSKPQQPQPELPAIDGRRSSAQEYSQASSPPAQLEQQQLQHAQPPKLGQLMGGFGQNVQRSYYRSAPVPQQQQPPHQNQQHQHYHGQQQQQYNRPPPRTYYGGQNRMAVAPNEPQQQHGGGGGGYQAGGGYQGQNRRGYQQYPSRQQYLQQGQNQWPAQRNNNGHQHHQQQQPHHAAPLIDGDFDFEQANKQFRETVTDVADKMAKAKLADVQEDKSNRSSARNSEERSTAKPTTEKQPIETGTKAAGGGGGRNENFYDKSISFFDNISCEALEKEEGKNTRVDWKKERMTNQETFGTSAVRMHNFRRGGGRGGGGYRGGYYQNRGGGGYQQRTRPLLPQQQKQ